MKKKDEATKAMEKATDGIRDIIDKLEKRDSPLARDPLVQAAKELANLGDILINRKK